MMGDQRVPVPLRGSCLLNVGSRQGVHDKGQIGESASSEHAHMRVGCSAAGDASFPGFFDRAKQRNCQVGDLAALKLNLGGRETEIDLYHRHRKVEGAAATQLALGPDAPALGLYQALRDGEAQPRPP